MNLNNLRQGELKSAFDALEDAFTALKIDFYLIGALARDTWYAKLNKPSRTTKDVDFAILIGSRQDYDHVKAHLSQHQSFAATPNNTFVMISPGGVEVDILPFGGLEINEEIHVVTAGVTSIKANGFMEVYQAGTEAMRLPTGHTFNVATLPAIVLLKLIAYDDRPEMRYKDARDIYNVINHYFNLQAELIYEHHSNVFENEDLDEEEVSALVIGREMRKIVGGNENLLERLTSIIGAQVELKEKSAFIRNMVQEADGSVDQIVLLLQQLQIGLLTE
jgi:predicted nucleotidyltransferase